jgi:hypothetical protein
MKNLRRTIIWLTLFSIAMGFMETAVVVYLRRIYYPEGFDFPLKPIEMTLAATEFYREIATLIMLVGIGILAGKNAIQRFAFFIYCFAIWDIFYYVFLKLILNWPASMFTWDILFLVPIPWVGPVIAPCITSLTMIWLAAIAVYYNYKQRLNKFKAIEWTQLIAGSIIMIFSFVYDYIQYHYKMSSGDSIQLNTVSSTLQAFRNYVPQHFAWNIFWIGELLIIWCIVSIVIRMRKEEDISLPVDLD